MSAVSAKPRPAEQRAVENERYRGVQHAVGIVRATVMVPADRIPELRALTLHWRQEAKLLLESDEPSADQIPDPCRRPQAASCPSGQRLRDAGHGGQLAARAGAEARHEAGAGAAPQDHRMNATPAHSGQQDRTKGHRTMRPSATGLALAVLASLGASRAAAQPTSLLPPGGAATPIASTVTVDADSDARGFLLSARAAVERGRTGEAREALERAETRLLGRATPPLPPVEPGYRGSVVLIASGRRSLAAHDRPATLRAIDDALAVIAVASQPPPLPPVALAEPVAPAAPAPPPVLAAPPPPPVPTITRALLAGHWALDGADWKWVPPETVPRRVRTAPLMQGRYVWRSGQYVWVPAHFAD